MRVTPKSENDIASANLWPAGEYDFEVSDAKERTSKAGNDMSELVVFVFNADGQRRSIYDYLVGTDGGAYKVRHFAESVGLLTQYETGELLATDMIGRTGRCKLIVKKDKTGEYPDKNAIADYVKPKDGGSAAPPKRVVNNDDLDDSIPF